MDDRLTATHDSDTNTVDTLSRPAQTGGSTDVDADRESPPSTPGWVKAFGIIAVVLVLLFVGMHLTGNGPMHTPSGGTEHGMQAP
jgi:hypothetical protein